MSSAAHTYKYLHVPVTWIVGFAVVLTVIVLMSMAVGSWDRASATTGATPFRVQMTPTPSPALMPAHPNW